MDTNRRNYSQYLEPGARLKVPRTTRYNRAKRSHSNVEFGEPMPADDPIDYGQGIEHVIDDDSFIATSDEGDDTDSASDTDCDSGGNALYDEIIHAVVDIKVMDILIIIFVFSVRHNLDWTTMESLAKLISFILNQSIPSSKYHFKKLFTPSDKMHTHFVCKYCKRYLGTRENCSELNLICSNCEKTISLKTKYSDTNFFVTLPIEDQLKIHVERSLRNGDLIFQHNNVRTNDTMTDIYHGDAYQNLIVINEGNKFLTLTVNTDGASIHKSTKNASIWPLQFFVNEICEQNRFATSNILIAALAYGAMPDMSCFLRPFIEELTNINNSGGISIEINGVHEKVKLYTLVWSLDSVAKCSVLKKVQFNGYYGCPYCLHPGSLVSANNIRYCKEHNAAERTNENSRTAMQKSHCDNTRVRGYYGISPLIALPHLT